jgi:hypothetical protein
MRNYTPDRSVPEILSTGFAAFRPQEPQQKSAPRWFSDGQTARKIVVGQFKRYVGGLSELWVNIKALSKTSPSA